MRILVTVGALALAASLAGIQAHSPGAERLKLEDVGGLRGGCVTNRALNTDKVQYPGSSYFFAYSAVYLVQCIRTTNTAYHLFYCASGTVTQTFMSTGTVQCSSDASAGAYYATAVSGAFGSFNISRIWGGFCGNLTGSCN